MDVKNFKNFNLNILGLTVPVTFHETVHAPNGVEVAGLFILDHTDNKFKIAVNVSAHKTKSEVEATVLHEFGHAVLYRLGLLNTGLNHDLEEIIVDGIATCLTENFDFEI